MSWIHTITKTATPATKQRCDENDHASSFHCSAVRYGTGHHKAQPDGAADSPQHRCPPQPGIDAGPTQATRQLDQMRSVWLPPRRQSKPARITVCREMHR